MTVDDDSSINVDYGYLLELNERMKKNDIEIKKVPMIILPLDCHIFNWMNPEIKYDKDKPTQKILIFNNKG